MHIKNPVQKFYKKTNAAIPAAKAHTAPILITNDSPRKRATSPVYKVSNSWADTQKMLRTPRLEARFSGNRTTVIAVGIVCVAIKGIDPAAMTTPAMNELECGKDDNQNGLISTVVREEWSLAEDASELQFKGSKGRAVGTFSCMHVSTGCS